MVEVILQYRAAGLGPDTPPVPLGSTDAPEAISAVRDALLRQAEREVAMWERIDAGVLAVRAAEFERLARVLRLLVPDDAEIRPTLRVLRAKRPRVELTPKTT